VKHAVLEPAFVEFVPSELNQGTLYVSMVYATTVHLCACGCGNRVVLPLSPAEWQLRFDGEAISLNPSIGNWEFPCQSHYWIRGNRISWAKPWSREQIEAGRHRDLRALETHFADQGANRPAAERTARPRAVRRTGWRRIVNRITRPRN
jgi:hypothetical protein